MRKTAVLLTILFALFAAGCESRTDRSEGGVLLSISDFDELPVSASVNGAQLLQAGEIVIQNIPKNAGGDTSSLMNVELRSYEVIYTRTDAGTRVPTPFVRSLFGVIPVNGSSTQVDIPLMGSEQFSNPPLSDLLFVNGGFDRETGRQVIIMKLTIRFFGRTLTGDEVATPPASFDVEFVP
jgi:hypothetical protein